jgi:signal peptidase I
LRTPAPERDYPDHAVRASGGPDAANEASGPVHDYPEHVVAGGPRTATELPLKSSAENPMPESDYADHAQPTAHHGGKPHSEIPGERPNPEDDYADHVRMRREQTGAFGTSDDRLPATAPARETGTDGRPGGHTSQGGWLPAVQPPPAAHRTRVLPWARLREEAIAWFRTLFSAAVYATLIVTFGFQVARVEGQSMAPTLADQDRLIVNKLTYHLSDPKRGDIVMLYYPLNPNKSFVKRVIAEEGDTVRIVDGRVWVNDEPIDDDFIPPEFRSHDDAGPQRVSEGYYFVMGDHRNNSSDSRHWGPVPKKYIIGKVQLRWWPIPHARVF